MKLARLEALFISIFENREDISRILEQLPQGARLESHLPGGAASAADIARCLARRMIKSGQAAQPLLWDILAREYPFRHDEIRRLQADLRGKTDHAPPAGSSGHPIKILFVTANPDASPALRYDRELRDIAARIRASGRGKAFELAYYPAASVADLRRALLDEEPRIVHFSGHGFDAGGNQVHLAFEHGSGREQQVSPDALARLFAILRDKIDVVVLNACYTEPLARALTEHVACALGMSTAIGDHAAIEFAAAFYEALARARTVGQAFELGCSAIDLAALGEEHKPRIATRKGVDAGRLVVASDPRQARRPAFAPALRA